MNKLWRLLFFKKDKKPRGWVFPVLLDKGGSARPVFRRVVHKKSGAVRPHFAPWMDRRYKVASSARGSSDSETAARIELPLSPDEVKLRDLPTLDKMITAWKRTTSVPALLPADKLVEHLCGLGEGPVILSISHDNYRTVQGGVQLCLQHEEEIARDRGMTYLQLHPWQPLPCLADRLTGDSYPVTILCDGLLIGTASIATVTDAVATLAQQGRAARVIVHHMMGHAPEAIARLVNAAGGDRPLLWLHDFFTLCPNYTLQRNKLKFCGVPDVVSNACGLCVFGVERSDHQSRMDVFFDAVDPIVIAPSDFTAAFWTSKTDLTHESLHILPHMTLKQSSKEEVTPVKSGRLTVGYLGAAAAHKGWQTFLSLISDLVDENVEFVILSDKRPDAGEDVWAKVQVTSATPDAMVRAVADQDLDFVLHWPSGPETFSFTTFEAMAGGAYVLTNQISGNVRAAVEKTGRGAVLQDRDALLDFFRDGSAGRLAQRRRASVAATALKAERSDLSFAIPNWI